MTPHHYERIFSLREVRDGTVRITLEPEGFCLTRGYGSKQAHFVISYKDALTHEYPVAVFRANIRHLMKPTLEEVA
jgi:hypothetical protein